MKYKGYLLDLDGTIYLGKELIPAGKSLVEELQRTNTPFLFVTNNTTKTPESVQERLKKEFDITVSASTVYTASLATIDYMDELALGKKVYVMGESGLVDLILEAGYEWSEVDPDYVVIGLDTKLTYQKIETACLAIQNGAHFIGTNPDKNLPTERGLVPGAGSLIAMIETASKTKPVIMGKPSNIIMSKAVARLGLEKNEVLMVGDNYETDIQAGIQNGVDSLLVLSGFTKKEDLPGLPQAPTHIVDSLAEWSLTE